MRLSKQQRQHIEKLQRREQSMVGWEQHSREMGKRQSAGVIPARSMVPEHGFHFARRMRTRIA